MSASSRLKTALASTTALIAITMMPSPAHAIPCNGTTTISTATTASINMCAGADLTVTGAGSISNTNPAVDVSGVTAHNISNSGTIKGTATGILIGNSGAISGTITNSGTISGGQWGIWVRTGNISGAVSNSGLIHGNGFAGFMVNGTVSGNLTNTAAGTISALFDGLFVQVGTVSGAINNSGLIHGASFAGIDIQKTSTVSGAITNGGTISGGRYGIEVRTNSVVSGGIVNNAGGIIHGGITGISVFNSGNISGAIDNSGTISGLHGIAVSSASISGGVVNRLGGVIIGTSTGILVAQNGSLSDVHNSGTISGGNFGIHVTSTKNGTGTLSGNITNSGTIKGGTAGIAVTGHNGGGGGFGGVISGSVINSGLISGGTAGIFLSGAKALATISGKVDNSGTITGGRYGIFLKIADITQGIVNRVGGTISGAVTGIAGLFHGDVSGGINNSGLIKGGGAGISLYSDGDFSGGITNKAGGVISGGATGISVGSTSDISGGIHNSGTITGIVGIGVRGSTSPDISGGVHNIAGGVIHGTNTGIRISSSANISGGVNNAGTISGGFDGIRLRNGGAITGLINSGTISGGFAGINLSGGKGASGHITGDVNNNGTIKGGSTGIRMNNSSSITGSIINVGTISGGSLGIFMSGGKGGGNPSIGGNITNSGTIQGSRIGMVLRIVSGDVTNSSTGTIGGGTTAIFLSGGKGGTGVISGSITNSGIIGGGSNGIIIRDSGTDIVGGIVNNSGGVISASGLAIGTMFGANQTGGIHNSGTIKGATGILVQSAQISGGITNNVGGVIQGTGGTAINLNALTGSTPIILNGGSIIGDVVDSNAAGANNSPVTVGGDFSTAGNFTVSDLTVTAGHDLTISSGDVFTTSRMTTPSTGTLTFAINNAGAGELVVNNGNGINLSVATLAARITGVPPVSGTEVMIGDGAAALIGPSGPGYVPTVLASSSAMWQFTAYDGSFATAPTDNTDLFLVATQVGTVNGLSNTASNATIGTVIEGQAGGPDPQLSAIADNLNNAQTQGDVNDVESSAGPTLDDSDVAGAFSVDDESLGLTDQHLAFLRTGEGDAMTGMAAGNIPHGVGMWGQVFGRHADQNDRDGVAGYTSDTWGGAVGVDTHNIGDHNVLGLAFSYGHTDANSDNSNDTDTDVDSYQLTLYGSHDFTQGYYLNGEAAYSWNNVDRDRHNVGGITGLTAHGDYDANMWAARAEGGRDFHRNGMTLTPNLTANWMSWDPDSYTETGAGGANLMVNGDTLNRFELGAGVKAGWEMKGTQGSLIKPELRAGYRYALVDDKVEDTAQFTGGGGAFRIEGADPGRSTLDLGATVRLVTTRNWAFTGSYDFNWKSDYTSHAGYLRAAYRF